MSEKAGNIKKAAAAGGLLVAACAACCTPLIVIPLVALFAAGGLGLALLGQIGLSIAVLGAIGGYLYLRRRAASPTKPGCGCAADSGCGSGKAQLAALTFRQG